MHDCEVGGAKNCNQVQRVTTRTPVRLCVKNTQYKVEQHCNIFLNNYHTSNKKCLTSLPPSPFHKTNIFSDTLVCESLAFISDISPVTSHCTGQVS